MRLVVESASALYFGGRVYASSMSSHLSTLRLQDNSLLFKLSYNLCDSTPMGLRVNKDKKNTKETPAATAATSAEHEPHKVAVKLMQSEAWKAYTFKNHSSGRIQCWLLPLLCPLQGLDQGTGENTKASIEESLHVPFDPLTDDQYTFTTAAFTLDRDGANNRAVKGIEGEQTPTMRLPCFVHIASTSEGRALNSVDADITGVIGLSLTQKSLGEYDKFKDALAAVIKQSVRPHLGRPPPDFHPDMQLRNKLLDLALPLHPPGSGLTSQQPLMRRRFELKSLLTGNILLEQIDVWMPGPCPLDIDAYSQRLAKALFPDIIELFPRSRWILSQAALAENALLCFHKLHERVVPQWLGIQTSPQIRGPPGWCCTSDEEPDDHKSGDSE